MGHLMVLPRRPRWRRARLVADRGWHPPACMPALHWPETAAGADGIRDERVPV